MVRLSSQHALNTNYIPYMFYDMLLPSHGPLKVSFYMDQFCCGVLPGVYCLVLMYV